MQKYISRKNRTYIRAYIPSSVAIATDTIILFVVSEEDDYARWRSSARSADILLSH